MFTTTRSALRIASRFSPLSRRFSTATSTAANAAGVVGLGKLNHIAIAVPDMAQACTLYRDVLGANVSEPTHQKDHGVTTVFVELSNTKIELLHPYGEKSPIQNFLTKNPSGGVHHVCIEVDDIHAAVKVLHARGVRVIDPEPKIGAHGKPVVFLHPKSLNGVMIELEQK